MKRNLLFLTAIIVAATMINLHAQTTLKGAFKNDFLIGVALKHSEYEQTDPRAVAIVKTQFNSISPENALKWQFVHPEPGKFDFKAADKYVDFGLRHHMFIVGGVLIWYHETPQWVFQDANGHRISRSALIARMRKHIFTVVGRYKGKVNGWDVVNEALNPDGSLYQSQWEKIIGPDYISLAYKFAHEADPKAQLYYNDYNLVIPYKRAGAVALIRRLKAQGIPITAVGLEAHYQLGWPTTNSVADAIRDFSALGVKVMISELDINTQPTISIPQAQAAATNVTLRSKFSRYTNGLPNSVETSLAKRYANLFKVFVANRNHISRVTFWGVYDGQSWLNNWPVKGRKSYPLVFDRNYHPKPAFYAIMRVADEQTQQVTAR